MSLAHLGARPARTLVRGLALAVLFTAPSAHAALDALCGTTITTSLTLDHDVDCTGYVGNALTITASGVTIDGAGYRLLAPDSTRAISISGGVSNVTVRDLAVEGWCTGVGVYVDGGSGHVLDNVVATGRSTGVDARNTTNLTIRDLRADSASTVGLLLTNVTRPLTLERLVLTNNLTGLRMNNFVGPQTLDDAAISDIRGSDTGIHFEANVSQVTVTGLTIDGYTYGINANVATNASLTFRDLDLSTTIGTGTGLGLQGANHRIERVVANRRANGVTVASGVNLVIDDLTANGAVTAGLTLTTPTGTLSLRKLTLEDNLTAFALTNFGPASQFSLTPYDPLTQTGVIASMAKSDTAFSLTNVQNLRFAGLTLDNPTYAINANAASNTNLLFEDLDLSCNRIAGTGLYLSGANHIVRRVTANRRSTGLNALTTSNLGVSDYTALGCAEGLRIATLAPPAVAPTLTRLTLNDNTTGLVLNIFTTPLVLEPANAIDVRGSLTGVAITGASANVTLRDLSFDNPTTGVSAAGTDHVFRRVDFSGPGRGTGLALSGARHTLDTVVANARTYGFNLATTSQLGVTGLIANHCGVGLYLSSFGAALVPPALADLDLSDNGTALYLNTLAMTAPFVIDAANGFVASDSNTGILIQYSSNISFVGLTLNNPYRAIDAPTGNSALTFTNVDVSGRGFSGGGNGYGINLAGANHTLTNVTANRRPNGISVGTPKGLTINNLTAQSCTTVALTLGAVAATETVPALSGLDLRDSAVGLELNGVLAPMVIDASTGLDVRGSNTGIRVYNSTDMVFRGLTLTDNPGYGIWAYYGNSRLTFEDLDLSGAGAGTGLHLGYLSNNVASYYGGPNHIIRNVVANHRAIGVNTIAASNLTITNLTATHNGIGLRLEGYTNTTGYVPPTLKKLTLSDNATGLLLNKVDGTALAPVVFGAYVPATDTGAIADIDRCHLGVDISTCSHLRFDGFSMASPPWTSGAAGVVANYSSNLTFRNLQLATTTYGIHVQYGNSAFTFENLDLSGYGVGVGLQIGYLSNNQAVYYGGPNHVLTNITANRRDSGVRAIGTSNLVVNGVTARNNTSRGLHIEGYTNTAGFIAPSLAGLVLDDNGTCLFLHNFGGTALSPYDLGPADITSISGCDTSLGLSSMTNTRVHDLTLSGRAYGVDASGTGLAFADLDVTGIGLGTGLRVGGADPVLDRITADRRDTGVFLNVTTNPTVRDVLARRARSVGVQLTNTTLPITLARLSVSDDSIGLRLTTVAGTGSLAIGAATLTTHARSVTAINLTSAPAVTVDTAALGLTQAGANYSAPAPASDPLCGTTLVSNLTLTADLDCSGITTTALTIGADNVTIDGGPNRYRVIAPRAATVIRASARNNVTIKRLDLSGTWVAGDGISIDGGTGLRIEDVTVDARDRGAYLRTMSNLTIDGFSAMGSATSGLHLETLTLPLSLTGLSLTKGGTYGLRLNGFNGQAAPGDPSFVLDGSALVDLGGNATSIYLEANVANVALVGPIAGLDGTSYGVNASALTNSALTLSDLDLSPRWLVGTGLYLQGANHQLLGLVSNYRATGADIRNASGLVISDLTASMASTEALHLEVVTPSSLTALNLTYSAIGLALRNLVGGGFVYGPYDPLLDTGAITSLAGCSTSISVSGSSNLRFEGLSLDARAFGINALSATNNTLTFADLDLSGTQHVGTGLTLGGSGHVIDGVIADDRDYGVASSGSTNLTVRHLQVDGALTTALSLVTTTLPLELTDLTLTRSGTGLFVNGLASPAGTPFVIEPFTGATGAIASLAGSSTAVTLQNVQNAVVQDLVLPNLGYGIFAGYATNSGLTFQRLDVSTGRGVGTGLYVQGAGHVVDDVTADFRATGVYVTAAANVELRRIRARGAYSYGMQLVTMTTPLTLVDLSLGDNATGLYLNGVTASAAAPLVLDPYVPATGTGVITDIGNCDAASIKLNATQYLRVTGLALDATTYGLDAYTTSNRGVLLDDLDLRPRRSGGTGVFLAGPDHRLTDLQSEFRGAAVTAGSASDLRITNLTARRGSSGLYLQSTTNTPATYTAPTLNGLDLRDNLYGLTFNNWNLPLTVDASAGLDLRESETGIYITNLSSNLTIRGLTGLDNPVQGILASNQVTGVRFEDLDLSGYGLGNGLTLSSTTSAVVQNVKANGRAYGVSATTSSNLTVTDLEARFGGTGLYIYNVPVSYVAPTLSGLTLSDNGTALYFHTVFAPTTIGASAGLDVSRSAYGVYVYYCGDLTFEDLALPAPTRGLQVDHGQSRNITVRRVDVSGTGRGRGVALDGSGHRLEEVIADDREYGVYAANAVGLVASDLFIDAAATAALYMNGVTATSTAPSLTNLHLTRSYYGLQAASLRAPMIMDGTTFADLSGNFTPIYFSSAVSDLTVRGLTLTSAGSGVVAGDTASARLTMQDLDVTGYCRGTGVSLTGTDNLVDGVVAGRRQFGIQLGAGDRFVVRDSVLGANTTGLQLSSSSTIVDTTVVADATNTATRFKVGTQAYMFVGQTLRVAMPGGPEDRVVSTYASNFVTFTTALSAVPPTGATVRALDYGSPRATLTSSDICANGTGVTAVANLTIASGNYWRASSGPRHASNPAGTGDLVTGTNITLSPFVTVPTDKVNPYCNQAPVAQAGPDQTACEGDTVTLDGSASYDPDVEPLLYGWLQLAGPTVTLANAAAAITTFTAPAPANPLANTDLLGFELTVDDLDIQRTDLTEVAITRRNPAPTAVAGADQAVDEGASVALSAAGSFDPEGTALSYAWVQTGGPAVVITDASTAAPTFSAPTLDVGGGPSTATLTFALTVTDQQLPVHCGGPRSHTDSVSVVVANVNRAPVAAAGPDQSDDDLGALTLDGTASADPDGDALTFSWTQLSGPAVTLTGATTATPSFTPPALPCFGAASLTFRLTVSDGFGGTHQDEVTIDLVNADSDTDGDGVLDCLDGCPLDVAKVDPGICGCGVADTNTDGDMEADCEETCDTDPLKTAPGICGCGVADTNSDGDAAADCEETCDADPLKTAPGVCGCGVPDVDTDGDLALDCQETCDADPLKTAPGVCGCDLADEDVDADGIIDCVDQCIGGATGACAGTPFFLSVKNATGRGQVACVYDGVTVTCAESAGVAVVTPATDITTCE